MQTMDDASTPTSAVRVHRELREAILEGELAPGRRLKAEELADQLRTSRTPVREAFALLAREGLVELQPRRGASVRTFDPADLLDLYEVRQLIEPYAARRAATRLGDAELTRLEDLCRTAEQLGGVDEPSVSEQISLNEEFHMIVIEGAASPRLSVAMRAASGIPRVFRAVFWRDDEQRHQSLFCHRELVNACRARRPGLAEAVMRMHILGATEFLKEVIDAPSAAS
jgi:DNA-binding GntR family transcriptional regulator